MSFIKLKETEETPMRKEILINEGWRFTGPDGKEIQATNANRSAAVAEGMTIQQAIEKYPCTPD